MDYIKWICIVACSLYTFRRLLDIRISSNMLCTNALFSVVCGVTLCWLRRTVLLLCVPVTAVLILGYLLWRYKIEIRACVAASMISIGLSNMAYAISSMICSIIFTAITMIVNPTTRYYEIHSFLIVFVFVLLVKMIFQVKRFKHGMPYLYQGIATNLGIVLGIILMTSATIINIEPMQRSLMIEYIFAVFSFIVLIVSWWHHGLDIRYYEGRKEREIQTLESQVELLTKQNEVLKANSDEQARIIHRDNKLIPAMERALEKIKSDRENDTGNSEQVDELLSYIRNSSASRSGMIYSLENHNKQYPVSHVAAIDTVTKYIGDRAYQMGANFDLIINADVRDIIDNPISELDLGTLYADLLENALNAVTEKDDKNILAHFGLSDNAFRMEVYDSGESFHPDVIRRMGKERFTTRPNDGGSGIGLMTTFDLLKKYGASFILDENIRLAMYSKRITITFDGMNRIKVISDRPEIIEAISSRDDIIYEGTAAAI